MRMIIVSFVLLTMIGGMNTSLACSCMRPGTPKEELEKFSVVFQGKVLSTELIEDQYKVTFEVSKGWKGIQSQYMTVYTPTSSAACGFMFRKNVEYVVYADASDGIYRVTLCSRTASVANATEDIEALGTPAWPPVFQHQQQQKLLEEERERERLRKLNQPDPNYKAPDRDQSELSTEEKGLGEEDTSGVAAMDIDQPDFPAPAPPGAFEEEVIAKDSDTWTWIALGTSALFIVLAIVYLFALPSRQA